MVKLVMGLYTVCRSHMEPVSHFCLFCQDSAYLHSQGAQGVRLRCCRAAERSWETGHERAQGQGTAPVTITSGANRAGLGRQKWPWHFCSDRHTTIGRTPPTSTPSLRSLYICLPSVPFPKTPTKLSSKCKWTSVLTLS